jgi:hypothetical protein
MQVVMQLSLSGGSEHVDGYLCAVAMSISMDHAGCKQPDKLLICHDSIALVT